MHAKLTSVDGAEVAYESASQCDVGLRDSFVDPTKYSSIYPGRRVVLYDQKLDVDSSRIYISSNALQQLQSPRKAGRSPGSEVSGTDIAFSILVRAC